jgi:hypothetical protein
MKVVPNDGLKTGSGAVAPQAGLGFGTEISPIPMQEGPTVLVTRTAGVSTILDEPTVVQAGGDSNNVALKVDVEKVVPPAPCANAV